MRTLGKTPVSLSLAERNACTKLLIVTINPKAIEPPSVSDGWAGWGTKFSDGSFSIYPKPKVTPSFLRATKDILILNYESLYVRNTASLTLSPAVLAFIDSCRGNNVALILDESHKIKNESSNQAKALSKIKLQLTLVANSLHTYLLTGTPFTTGYIDLYAQLKFLGCPMKKQEFKDRFCELGHIKGLLGWQQPIVGYKNIDQLYNLVHRYAVTTKSEDVLQLPPKLFVRHVCASTKDFIYLTKEKLKERDLWAYALSRKNRNLPTLPPSYEPYKATGGYLSPWFRNMAYPDQDYLADTPALLWMRARQLSVGFQGNSEKTLWFDKSRFAALKKFLEDNPDNYLLFYNYVPEFVELYDLCDSLQYNIDVYNGDIKSMTFYNKYAEQTEAQRLTNKRNVIIANFASGSTGMNWQLYNRCIIFSLPLYKDFEQGIKRVHRTGSKDTVIYHMFIGDNWLDKRMLAALEERQDYSAQMFTKDFQNFDLQ